jgi:hypothetical protein
MLADIVTIRFKCPYPLKRTFNKDITAMSYSTTLWRVKKGFFFAFQYRSRDKFIFSKAGDLMSPSQAYVFFV